MTSDTVGSVGSAGYTVKSCGKAHATCRECNPEAVGKATAAVRTPEARAANSLRKRRYYAEDPAARWDAGVRMFRYYEAHPEQREARTAHLHTPEVQAKAAATKRTPGMRQVASAARRRYEAYDEMTGGWRVEGWFRDLRVREHLARERRQQEA